MSQEQTRGDTPGGLELPPTPLLGAESVQLAELSQEVSFHVYVPDDPLATSDLVSQVWLLEEDSKICIVYSTGLLVYEAPESIGDSPVPQPSGEQGYGEAFGEESDDTSKAFAQLARRLAEQDARDFGIDPNDELGTVKETISFQVAYVPGENFGTVEFSYGGVRIALKGEYDVETLTRIANSMQ